MTAAPVDFTTLSETEQRAVAERLLKIEESGWKPFWCARPDCTGDPHKDAKGVVDPQWSHNHARKDQRLPAWNKRWILFIMSGRGCLAPWTLIDLADGTRERVDALAERGEAVEVMTPDGPRWTDGAPFLKGEAHQWRVRLSTGRVLTVTDKHRFLAPGGWLQLDHVHVGQPLVAALPAQDQSGAPRSRGDQSGWREDAQRCWGTELGSGCGCPTCRRQGDLPLPVFPETDQGAAPSPAGEAGRTHSSSGSDERESSRADTPTCRPSDHLTRIRSSLSEPSQEVDRSQGVRVLDGSSPRSPGSVPTSLVSTDPEPPTGGGRLLRSGSQGDPSLGQSRLRRVGAWLRSVLTHQVPLLDPARSESPPRSERSGLVWVESIEYSHFGPFYDLTVPGPESYHSEGVVNHNSGKTRTGVEFVTLNARKGLNGAIIGRRGEELVNTHVAEILKAAHPEFTPEHQVSKNLLLWPNGAITYLFSAERPENIRSVNLSYAWLDEAAHMDEVETAWMNTKFATRVKSPGNPIHFLITSTPTGTPWVMKMEDDPSVEVRRVSTYANRANLDADFLADLEKEYEGTRMGRQELHGEVLRDVEGALWTDDLFKHLRVEAEDYPDLLESMDDRVLAVDPAGSKGPRSDATGIIGCGAQHNDDDGSPLQRSRLFVLGRATIKGSPTEWAEQTFKAARLMRVNRIVVEKNFGGEMVRQTLMDYAAQNPGTTCDENGEPYKIELVHAAQSKETRAEPTVAKYEQGLVTHVTSPTVFGDLSELEKQQVNWVPKSRGGRLPSPNDVDALVWAIRALESKVKFAGQMASQRDVMSKLKRR